MRNKDCATIRISFTIHLTSKLTFDEYIAIGKTRIFIHLEIFKSNTLKSQHREGRSLIEVKDSMTLINRKVSRSPNLHTLKRFRSCN